MKCFPVAEFRVDSPWISLRERVENLMEKPAVFPQVFHTNPTAAHTPPGRSSRTIEGCL